MLLLQAAENQSSLKRRECGTRNYQLASGNVGGVSSATRNPRLRVSECRSCSAEDCVKRCFCRCCSLFRPEYQGEDARVWRTLRQ
jgi:hypothetical protein